MAGYALGYEGGGAIPDEDPGMETTSGAQDDNSGASPVVASGQPDDNSGAAPVVPPQQQGQEEDPGGSRLQAIADAGKQSPVEGARQFPGNLKRIVSYLMGEGAADPNAAKKFQIGVMHEYPGINPDDANVLSVHKAQEMGGPGAAWAMMQFNRQAYNAKQSFADAALAGTQGKPPDAHAAADAATKASQHVLDGSQAHFTADDQGFITATVKLPGSDTPQTYRMSPDQFRQYTDVGKAGQYDRVLELGGVPGTLQRIVGQPGKGGALPTGAPDTQGSAAAPAGDDRVAQLKKVMGDYPISQDDINSGYDPDTIAKGYARFGHGMGQAEERNQWMAEQEDKQANRENQVTVAQEKGKLANERARITGTGRVQQADVTGQHRENSAKISSEGRQGVQEIKNQGQLKVEQERTVAKLKQMEQKAASEAERNKIRIYLGEATNPNFLIQSDAQREAFRKRVGIADGSPAAAPAAPTQVQTQPAPTAQAAPPQRPEGVPKDARFWKGQWYTRGQDGSAVPFQMESQ